MKRKEPQFRASPAPSVEPSLSLADLYRSYSRWLVRKLRGRFGADAAEDLAQEAFLRVSGSGAAEDVRHPQALLFKIAVNAAHDLRRHDNIHAPSGAVVAFPAVEQRPDPATQVETLLLKQVVLSLPTIFRDVFVLSRFVGWSYQEIADHLGVSVKTVEWRMNKALARCAEKMRD